jgi:hypothetical protein
MVAAKVGLLQGIPSCSVSLFGLGTMISKAPARIARGVVPRWVLVRM